MFTHCFFLEAMLVKNLFCSSGVVFGGRLLLLQVIDYCDFFGCMPVWILDIFMHLVGEKDMCYWYLSNINIFF
jgi:hypothetical protein